MGGIGSKEDSQQVLFVGLRGSGKTLFLKKLMEINKKEKEEINLEPTLGYNFINLSEQNIPACIWDLGGDVHSIAYWPTFYRCIKFDLVVYFINLSDNQTQLDALRELLILLNEEELKSSRFYIIFNIQSLHQTTDESIKEYSLVVEDIILMLKECPIHEFESRVEWEIMDIRKTNISNDFLERFLKYAIK